MQVARFWRMKQQYYRMEAYKADAARPEKSPKNEAQTEMSKKELQTAVANVA